MKLQVNGLSFRYNARHTLENISFSVAKGEILAILGPNGVGKTTLLKCINGMLKPDRGSVLVDRTSVLSMGVADIARQMSYVAQQAEPARMTAFDAILMGRRPHIRFRVPQKDIKMVDAVIRRLGMEKIAMSYIDQMSGGELQKVCIARALVQDTGMMLLDEPTSNLDLKNQAGILHLLRRVATEHDVTMVMTMHDLNAALRYADKYLFLKDRMIFDAGTVDAVRPETVEAVYGIPVEIIHHRGFPVIVPDNRDMAA